MCVSYVHVYYIIVPNSLVDTVHIEKCYLSFFVFVVVVTSSIQPNIKCHPI